ncbi:hypothetical protein P3S51_03960 [Acinetobacter sp. ANC 7201]|uniref:hypothetical protein n=1 Tax=Acinetobacter sp. ANC 7201 TaxID=3035288 RepID=UPI00279E4B0B|nr:hypothetical protein [Acinetobacter sp. ANC 7201]WFP97499.1 hypothetical protein P3S51_03960 [Acinetobacter sp. ANC 7201]
MELQVIEQNAIVQAFLQAGGTQQLVARIAEEARKHVPDVTTKKGRDAIGSVAMKVSKSKTLISKLGKDLVAEEKARIKLVDADRIQAEKELDALRDEILAPRDAWEQAEKDRVAKHETTISVIRMPLSLIQNEDGEWTAQSIKDAISGLENRVIDSSFEEYEEQAKLAKFETLEVLRKALIAREKYEAEQAELERLRIAEQQRIQQEHEERIAREATEKATREAEEKARLEAERVQREKLEAEQREARLKAEKEAALLREEQLKQQAIEREKQAEIDRQNAIEAERKRIEQEAQAKAEAERKAEEARLANVEHRKQICSEALKGLTDLGLSVDQGKAVLNAINKGLVPHVSIKF